MTYAFAPAPVSSIAVHGTSLRFPVHRIYCIGRNYADHAKEMGVTADKSHPVFFLKPADAIVVDGGDVPYPPGTNDLHHELEMVAALHRGGSNIALADALDHVYAYGVGLDLTRRDLQAVAKAKGTPWDSAKGFDASAPVSSLHRVADAGGHRDFDITLEVNGQQRQAANTADMVFSLPEIIRELSLLFTLAPGDLIYTGTPAGVAALVRGDSFVARLGGLAECRGRIV